MGSTNVILKAEQTTVALIGCITSSHRLGIFNSFDPSRLSSTTQGKLQGRHGYIEAGSHLRG